MTQHLNMYEILEKLRQVSGSESAQQAVEQIEAFNNIKEDSSQRLDEKYMGWKKTVAAIKKGGSAKDPEAVAASIGRKKYGKEKFQKAAAAGKKLGEASKPDFLDLDKDGNKTEPMKKAAREKKIKEEGECNHTTEGVMCPKHGLKECGMYEEHDKPNVRDILQRMAKDVKVFKATGELTDALYNELFDAMMDQMPYGTAKARTGDPYQWISRRLEKMLAQRQQVDEIDVNLIKAAQKHAKEHPAQKDPESERNVHKKYGSRTDRDETTDDDYDEFGNLKASAKKKVSGHVEPGARRGPGRPKKYTADAPRKERVTAKSRKTDRVAHGQAGFKKTKKVKEGEMPGMDAGEYDREGDMAKDQLYSISKAAKELHGILGDEQNLPEWVQSKITKALDYIQTANRYMDQERHDARSMDESALQAYLGTKKYGETGMKALQKAGREGASKETMARIRARHDKMDEADMEEGNAFTAKLKDTPKGGKFKLGDKEFTDTSNIEEKAVSKQQQKFMGMAHAMQKGEKIKGASPELKKVARTMKKKDVTDFAKTKRKDLPRRVKDGKAVDETTTAGSVAPAMTKEAEITQGPNKGKQWSPKTPGATNPNYKPVDKGVPSPDDGATAPPPKAAPKKKAEAPGAETAVAETDKNPTDSASKKSKGGMQFGKGIYDSMNRDLEAMISEGLNISSNMDTEGGKNITISASDEDAEMLANLLKMAGIGSQDAHDESCPHCGKAPCGCDMIDEVEENDPDWPSDMGAKQDTHFMTQTIAGGLNRRKPDQTTLPQTMVRVAKEQQAAMEGIERGLWNLYKKVGS